MVAEMILIGASASRAIRVARGVSRVASKEARVEGVSRATKGRVRSKGKVRSKVRANRATRVKVVSKGRVKVDQTTMIRSRFRR